MNRLSLFIETTINNANFWLKVGGGACTVLGKSEEKTHRDIGMVTGKPGTAGEAAESPPALTLPEG